MEQTTIIIAGLGSAGFSALTTVKRINPKARVVVIDPKEKDIVHPCGLPYALEGIVSHEHLSQDIYLNRMNVEKITGTVQLVDAANHKLVVTSGSNEQLVNFDRAIICTGYKPLVPPIVNIKKYYNNGVYTLSSVHDLLAIKSALHGKQRALVVGAGAIGLEMAYALQVNGLQVTVIEAKDVLPNALDSDMAAIVADYCTQNNIALALHAAVNTIEKSNNFIAITNDAQYNADIIIVACGFAPNCDWAIASSLKTSKGGAIVTDNLQVCPDVYAAGDCIECWSVIDKKPLPVKLATSAYKQGVVAAENGMGGNSVYAGTAGTFVTVIGNLEIAATGFSTDVAKERGFSVIAGKISATVKPEYFPSNERLTMKVLCDIHGKVIGAQAIGHGAASRINIVSLAINKGLTIDDLLQSEMAYCPAVSEVNDILLKACEFAKRRMK